MTVIIDMGDWWIEVLEVTVPVNDAAGFYNSAVVALTKPGHCMSTMIDWKQLVNNDASQNNGGSFTITGGGGLITAGSFLINIIVQVQKAASTAGAQNQIARVTLIMRS